MAQVKTESGRKATNWQIILVLLSAGLLQMNWATLSPVLPVLQSEFSLDNTMIGLVSSMTVLAHMLMQVPAGSITDRIGPKRTIQIGGVIVGLAVICAGLAPTFPLLLTARFFIGVGTGMGFIAGLTMMTTLVQSDKTALAQGSFTALATLGFLVALFTSEWLTSTIGWRLMLIIEGAIILVYCLLALNSLPKVVLEHVRSSARWTDTLRQPTLLFLGLAGVSAFAIQVALVSWGSIFLWQNYGVDLRWAGPLTALLNITAAMGCLVGGALAAGRERLVIIVFCLITAVGMALLPFLPSVVLVVIALLILGCTSNIPLGPIFSFPTRVLRRSESGLDLSVMNFLTNIGSFSFPVVIGAALDATGSFTTAFGQVGVIGLICAVAASLWLIRLPLPSASVQK